ncbi:MAG: hypothetical protein JWP97_1461 [Labilithrix sp.]|nr:hypothetical protein [Labilithrix sp.]
MTAGDRARVTVLVAVPPADAFEIFTKEIDLWWRTGPAYRIAGRRRGQLHFEGGVGGRLFESFVASKASAATRTIQVGSVTAWDPPTRLAFEWRGVNFAPGESTMVEVLFAPSPSGTTVTVEHRGFSALRDDHPVRHGKPPAAFIRQIGLWWGSLLTGLREHIATRPPAP